MRCAHANQHHVDRGDWAACGGDDPCWERIRVEVGLGDWQQACGWIDAAHLAMRQILAADMGGQLL